MLLYSTQVAAAPVESMTFTILAQIGASSSTVIVSSFLLRLGASNMGFLCAAFPLDPAFHLTSSPLRTVPPPSNADASLPSPLESLLTFFSIASGMTATILGLVYTSNRFVWLAILLLFGISDMSPFLARTIGRNYESEEVMRAWPMFFMAIGMIGTGTARMLGGVLMDAGGKFLLLYFVLAMQCCMALMSFVYVGTLFKREGFKNPLKHNPFKRENSEKPAETNVPEKHQKPTLTDPATVACLEDHTCMRYCMYWVMFTTGLGAGIINSGTMLHFETHMSISNSITGIFYMIAYIIGFGLICLSLFEEAIPLLKPPFDLVAYLIMSCVSALLFCLEGSIPAALGMIFGLVSYIVISGVFGRVIQAYTLPSQEGVAIAVLQVCRYFSLGLGAFFVALVDARSMNVYKLLWAYFFLQVSSLILMGFLLVWRIQEVIEMSAIISQQSDPRGLRSKLYPLSCVAAFASGCKSLFDLERDWLNARSSGRKSLVMV